MDDEQRVALLLENKKDRNRWRRRAITLVIVLVTSAIFSIIVDFLNDAGTFREIVEHAPGECALVEGFTGGTEDMAPWYDRKGTFISSPDFSNPNHEGKIYWLSFKKGAEPEDITPELDFSFQPHGIAFYQEGKTRKLYVVNHRNGSALPQHTQEGAGAKSKSADVKHTIEVFTVSKRGKLTFDKTLEDPLLVSPNDVTAVGDDLLYVTNDHGATEGFERTLEDYLRLPNGNVLYFDGTSFKVAYEGTRYANGITSDGTSIWLAETTGLTVSRLTPSNPPGKLTLANAIDVRTGVDNLTIDEDGALWFGAHPKLLQFVEHAKDPATNRSPSHVVRITGSNEKLENRDLYMNLGDPLSGSSVAVHRDGLLFIGAVYDKAVLRCIGKRTK